MAHTLFMWLFSSESHLAQFSHAVLYFLTAGLDRKHSHRALSYSYLLSGWDQIAAFVGQT